MHSGALHIPSHALLLSSVCIVAVRRALELKTRRQLLKQPTPLVWVLKS